MSIRSVADNVDVLIVDDGSDKPIQDYIDTIRALNTLLNIYFIRNEGNCGIPKSLNRALAWADENKDKDYKYYCRLDSGDEFIGDKISAQRDFLESNPDYVMVGSNAVYCNEQRIDYAEWIKPEFDLDIKREMHINSPYIHSSAMFRLDAIHKVGGYDCTFLAAQDYRLLADLIPIGKFKNLQSCYVRYEFTSNSVSSKKRLLQIINRIRIQLSIFNFTPIAFYGLARSILLVLFPRS
ncbi:MAG: glycosyltransferase, partial [Colwellia sp.]